MVNKQVHIPFLSEDEKLFLNTTATFSQARRMSNTIDNNSCHQTRASVETRRHDMIHATPSLSSFLWKRRGSSTSSLASSSSSSSLDLHEASEQQQINQCPASKSPKARELETLIFDQPQRTVRLSITPRCAI